MTTEEDDDRSNDDDDDAVAALGRAEPPRGQHPGGDTRIKLLFFGLI